MTRELGNLRLGRMRPDMTLVYLASFRDQPTGARWDLIAEGSIDPRQNEEQADAAKMLEELLRVLEHLDPGAKEVRSTRAYLGKESNLTAIAVTTDTGMTTVLSKAVIRLLKGLEDAVPELMATSTVRGLRSNSQRRRQSKRTSERFLTEEEARSVVTIEFCSRDKGWVRAFAIPVKDGPVPVTFEGTTGSKVYTTRRDRVRFLSTEPVAPKVPVRSGPSTSEQLVKLKQATVKVRRRQFRKNLSDPSLN